MIDLTLAHKYNRSRISNWSDWRVSEKLDGHRAYWDGHKFWSRGGKIIHAPYWFVREFPNIKLDGELYIGRGMLEKTSSTVRRKTPDHKAWEDVLYYVFDSPEFPNQCFKSRYLYLHNISNPNIRVVPQFMVYSEKDLQDKMREVVEEGGEGLMLRNAWSGYEYGRTHALMKMKPVYDAEAVVIGYEQGNGRNANRLGALVCKMLGRDIQFKCSGMNDYLRDNPPAVGSIITYQYQGLTIYGVPRHPNFLRIREEALV